MTTYSCDKGVLTLIDPELELSYQAPFTLPSLPDKLQAGPIAGTDYSVAVIRRIGVIHGYAVMQGSRYTGECITVYPDGSLKGRQYYQDGTLHGPSRFYSSTGSLLTEKWYLNGLAVGQATLYYPQGQVYSRQRYLQGLWHGLQQYYYADGTLKTSMHYHHGKLDGEARLYHSDGALDRAFVFKAGQLISSDIRPPHPRHQA